ncbi:hypothetical protein AVEN_211367-1, partial [Araneus ventricosus]
SPTDRKPSLFRKCGRGMAKVDYFMQTQCSGRAIVAIFWHAVTDHFSKWTVDMMNVDYCSERAVERESGSGRHVM